MDAARRDFRAFIFGTFSNNGSEIFAVALPVVAAVTELLNNKILFISPVFVGFPPPPQKSWSYWFEMIMPSLFLCLLLKIDLLLGAKVSVGRRKLKVKKAKWTQFSPRLPSRLPPQLKNTTC